MPLTIHPLVTARLALDASRMTYLRNVGQRWWVPSIFFAILGADEPILVDTSGQAEHLRGMRSDPVEPVLEFEEALAKVGLTPWDITLVIHTHLMYDHCANSKRLPRARFVVQKKELEFARDPHPVLAGTYRRELFDGLKFEAVEGDTEIKAGIRLLSTPGHTPGTQSVAVETEAGLAVITGFCCVMENFNPTGEDAWKKSIPDEIIPPGIHTDMIQSYSSAVRVKSSADLIIPIHEKALEANTQIPPS